MNNAIVALNQVIIMFLIILVGIISYKSGIITKSAGKCLSAFVLSVVSPSFIFMSYQTELNSELVFGLLWAFFMSIITHILLIIISHILLRKNPRREIAIERFSVVYTNCGFMGIPLIEGIFHTEGVLYVTAYLTIFNILVWTHGLIMMKGKASFKELIGVLKSPAIIAIVLGLICFAFEIRIPDLIAQPLNYVGSMNTPLAMIVAGITTAQTDFKKLIKNIRVTVVSIMRLVVAPLIIIPILSFIPCSSTVYMSVMIAMCCPAAAIGTLFAVRYEKNAIYAAEIFALSTILSAATIPLMILYMNLFS